MIDKDKIFLSELLIAHVDKKIILDFLLTYNEFDDSKSEQISRIIHNIFKLKES